MSGLSRLLRGRAAAGRLPAPAQTDISVVVPLYNHARYVGAALASVLAQTATPREIVLIDDGSIDGGLEIARAALRGLPNCRIVAQANAGAHAALNRAIGMAEGSYIAVLNSDDLFHPEKLAWCHAQIRSQPATNLIAGRVGLIDAGGARLARGAAAEWLLRAHAFADRTGLDQLALLHENHVATTSNMVFSRALWHAVGGFAALRYCHDLDFLMRAYDLGNVVLDREREYVRYRIHPRNTIGEDVHAVNVELAAVMAATIFGSGERLLPRTQEAFAAFLEVAQRKDVSDLVLYFVAQRAGFDSRDAFYAFATTPANREPLAARLRARRRD